MATWNSAQLATQVLTELGIVAAGDDASAEDLKRVTDVWPSIYAQLRRAGLAPFSSSAVSEEFQHPLAKYVAGQVASRFNFTGRELQEKQGVGHTGWIELQECAATPHGSAAHKIKFY